MCQDCVPLVPGTLGPRHVVGTDTGIHHLPSTACTACGCHFFNYLVKRPSRDARPRVANVSVAQKWVLGGRKKFILLLFSYVSYPGDSPFSLPLSPACCAPSTMGTAYHARYQLSGPSPLFVSPAAGGGGQALQVEDDRERGARDDWGEGQPGTQGCWDPACGLASDAQSRESRRAER